MLTLNVKNIVKARKMLFRVTNFLDHHNIKYFLEGGTLLGIVRDGDLLPWDHDVDISISSNDAPKFDSLRWRFFFSGYRITSRKGTQSYGPIKPNDYRIFKMKPLGFSFFKIFYPPLADKMVIVDIFVKIDDSLHTYWQSMGKILRVNKSHYSSQENIQFKGKLLTVPANYKNYLTAKYGDWSIPVKEWLCKDDEKAIVNIKQTF
jgi:phosphorylcholine metabolism protein LicD